MTLHEVNREYATQFLRSIPGTHASCASLLRITCAACRPMWRAIMRHERMRPACTRLAATHNGNCVPTKVAETLHRETIENL